MHSKEWSQSCASQSMWLFVPLLCVHITSLCSHPNRLETILILKGGITRTLTQAFNIGIALPLMMALTFITFAAVGGEVTPRRVFTTLSLIGFLRRSSITFIVRCFFIVYEARVALVRIQVTILIIHVSMYLKARRFSRFTMGSLSSLYLVVAQ